MGKPVTAVRTTVQGISKVVLDEGFSSKKEFTKEYYANFQLMHEKMPTEGIENRLSWEGKSLKRIMTERQSYSARLKRPGGSFASTGPNKPNATDEGYEIDKMLQDISENVVDTNRINSNHQTKMKINIQSMQSTLRSMRDNPVKASPIFKSKFKESFSSFKASSNFSVSHDEVNVSLTARAINQAKTKFSHKIKRSIPCLSFNAPRLLLDRKSKSMSERLILYFHANGEDLSHIAEFLSSMCDALNISIIAMEYPGYGLYHGAPNEDQILEDAEDVLSFVVNELKVDSTNIVAVGRSIGSGPAVHLASKFKIGGLVLVSPFTSIKAVIRDKVGLLISNCIRERFNNLGRIENVKCKLKIVHGAKDELVRPEHSKLLASKLLITLRQIR